VTLPVDESLAADVAGRIGLDVPDADFVSLCLEVAAAQGRRTELDGLDGVEPLPEGAFKLMTVACFPPSEAEAEFRTSGTTTGSPGRHLVRDLSLYRRSALAGFERFVMYPPRPAAVLSLIPPGDERPASSLSVMASFVADSFPAGTATFCRRGPDLDIDVAFAALRRAAGAGAPVVVLGTTLDFLTLLDAFEAGGADPIPLPAGSRVMHTGGPKAAGREVSAAALHAGLARRLAIAPGDAVEEFGMTELLSQAYDSPRVTTGPRRLVPVPWMRTRVKDPMTMADVADGDRGLLVHYDLANVHTAVAILTSDLARRVGDGFADVARLPGAPARGCSAEAATSWRGGRR
jgi:hypothetical protein